MQRNQVESDGDIAGRLVKEGTRVGSAGRLTEDLEDVESRIHDPRNVLKLTAMDLKSCSRWYDYSRARDAMFVATDTAWAPWHIAHTDVKKRGRLNIISHLLSPGALRAPAGDLTLPKRQRAGPYREFPGL